MFLYHRRILSLPALTGSLSFNVYERVRHLFSFSTLFDYSSVIMFKMPNWTEISSELMRFLKLGANEATVLIEQSTAPETIQVYVFDDVKRPQSLFDCISTWHGYPVKIVRSPRPKLQPLR
jgi:hypothetical protein